MEKLSSDKVLHRIARYVIVTAIVQVVFGSMLLATMYGRGPISLLFLIVMANIAYPWLMQNAIISSLWPSAILIGSFFMFFIILTIGETIHWLKTGKVTTR